jgi:hypothetical protein
MKNVSEKNCLENQNTFLMLKAFFLGGGLFENRALFEIVTKYCTAGQATDYNNTAHPHCILDTHNVQYLLLF